MVPRDDIAVNPAVLAWARKESGYSLERVARRLQVKADRVAAWEDGEIAPTFNQVQNLGRFYHRPLSLFFSRSRRAYCRRQRSFAGCREFRREKSRLNCVSRFVRYRNAATPRLDWQRNLPFLLKNFGCVPDWTNRPPKWRGEFALR